MKTRARPLRTDKIGSTGTARITADSAAIWIDNSVIRVCNAASPLQKWHFKISQKFCDSDRDPNSEKFYPDPESNHDQNVSNSSLGGLMQRTLGHFLRIRSFT